MDAPSQGGDRRLPRFVVREVENYLRCGDPTEGFAWLWCGDCDHHRGEEDARSLIQSASVAGPLFGGWAGVVGRSGCRCLGDVRSSFHRCARSELNHPSMFAVVLSYETASSALTCTCSA